MNKFFKNYTHLPKNEKDLDIDESKNTLLLDIYSDVELTDKINILKLINSDDCRCKTIDCFFAISGCGDIEAKQGVELALVTSLGQVLKLPNYLVPNTPYPLKGLKLEYPKTTLTLHSFRI